MSTRMETGVSTGSAAIYIVLLDSSKETLVSEDLIKGFILTMIL